MPLIKKIMNTQAKNGSTKWCDKRNNIAHNAESFGRKDTYIEYREQLLSGIEELMNLLEVKKT